MNLFIVFILLFVHTMADFFFQQRKDAENKHHSIRSLLNHTVWYSLLFIPGLILFNTGLFVLCFVIITFLLHTIQDYITSKMTHHYFIEKDLSAFWTTVGFDQYLHIVQLLSLYKILELWNL